MKIRNGGKDQELLLEFSDEKEFEEFFTQTDEVGFFSLPSSSVPQGTTFRASAIGSLRTRRIKPLKIVKESDSFRVVLVEKEKKPGGTAATEEIIEEKRELAKSVAEQIRELSVTEKAMVAMRGSLAERRVLMQDTNPKIQEFLLRNPKLTESEIAWIAKNPMSAIPTLLTIIQHKGWMSVDSVRHGILTNPKTPAHIILDKIPTLSAGDLIKMYHAKNLREDVRDAVSRQIKKRGIRIRALTD